MIDLQWVADQVQAPPPDLAARLVFAHHLWVPLPPNTANPRRAGRSWRGAWAAKKAYIKKAVGVIGVQLPALRGLATTQALDYLAVLVVPGRRDPDNLGAMLKWPIDALRRAGVMPNDTERWFRPVARPVQDVLAIRRHKDEPPQDFAGRQLRAAQLYRVHFYLWNREAV